MVESVVRDLRYAVRLLGRSPGFTLTAIVALALGIGINTTIFSVANAVVLQPLSAAEPDRLVRVYSNAFSNTSYAEYADYRDGNRTLDELAAFQLAQFSLRVGAAPEPVSAELVSANYFATLGVHAALGQMPRAVDDLTAEPLVVLDHRFWVRRFDADPDIVGRTLSLNGQPFTVAGVAPDAFTGVMAPFVPALWVPLGAVPRLYPGDSLTVPGGNSLSLHLIGRLGAEVTHAAAQTDLSAIHTRMREAVPAGTESDAVTVHRARQLHPEMLLPVTGFAGFLMLVAGLVLVITCLNLATLSLARASERRREIGVRRALGAGRGRVVRQLLTEGLLLAAAGATGGVLATGWAAGLLQRVELPTPVPVVLNVALDLRVLVFAVVAALLATVVFGLAPALQATGVDVVSALKTQPGGSSVRRSRLRSGLVVAQVALSLVLLITAGLFLRSLQNAQTVDLGFDQDRVLAVTLDLETAGHGPDAGRRLFQQLRAQTRTLPGVRVASVVRTVPLTLSNTSWPLLAEGQSPPPPGGPAVPSVNSNAVAPGYFDTLGIPLLAGRDFTDRDGPDAPAVVIVNETLARRYWPGESPIGKRVRRWAPTLPDAPYAEVVGLVRDSKYVTVGEAPRAFLFRSLVRHYSSRATLLIAATGDPLGVRGAVLEAVGAIDPDLPALAAAPLADLTSLSLTPSRVAGVLLGVFGLLALVLAAIGLYGVVAVLARQRTRELGIRLTLGAQPRRILATVIGPSVRWTAWGLAVGLGVSWMLTRFLTGLLHGVSPTDPLTFVGVSVLLAAVALLAAYVPARRAVRLQPVATLRAE